MRFVKSLLISSLFFIANHLTAQTFNWEENRFGAQVISGTIYNTVVYNNELYAAGSFINIGPDHVSFIAKWDQAKSKWSSVGYAENHPFPNAGKYIYNMIVADGKIVVVGDFPGAGIYNGSQWTFISEGLGESCYSQSVVSINGGLVMAGFNYLVTESGNKYCYVVKWVDNKWTSVSTEFFQSVPYQITYFKGDTLVGGYENYVIGSGKKLWNMMKLKNGKWENFGAGFNGSVSKFTVFQDTLYATGYFSGDSTGAGNYKNFAKWNGNNFVPLFNSSSSYWASGLWSLNDELYFSGPNLYLPDENNVYRYTSIGKIKNDGSAVTAFLELGGNLNCYGIVDWNGTPVVFGDGLTYFNDESHTSSTSLNASIGYFENGKLNQFALSESDYETHHFNGIHGWASDAKYVDGKLYVIGNGIPTGNSGEFSLIGEYDGEKWTNLPFKASYVYSIATGEHSLYVFGKFTNLSDLDLSPSNFALIKMNTTDHSLSVLIKNSPETYSKVIALKNHVWVAGVKDVTFPDNTTATYNGRFMHFDGTNWDDMNGGLTTNFYSPIDMAVEEIVNPEIQSFQYKLHVLASENNINNIADADKYIIYNQDHWEAIGTMGEGVDPFVGAYQKLRVYKGTPYVQIAYGGTVDADGTHYSPLVFWDGAKWKPVDGITGSKHTSSLAVSDSGLYLSGIFFSSYGNRFVHYNPEANRWTQVAELNDGYIANIVPTDDGLYAVGGYINTVNGIPCYNMARLKSGTSDAVENKNQFANDFSLRQNYPNPFNPTTNFEFTLAANQTVTLKIYDLLGREVATILNNEVRNKGLNKITFDARNLASGTYLYRLTSGKNSISKMMVLLK